MNRIKSQWREIPVRWITERWVPRIEHQNGVRCDHRSDTPAMGPGKRRARAGSPWVVRRGSLFLRSEIRSTWR